MFHPWYIYILALGAGVLAGAINTLAGSGSLITLPMLVFLGLPPTVANGTNRVGIVLQNIVGIATLRRGGKLSVDGWSAFAVPVLLGAALGAIVAVDVDEALMNDFIGAVMILMLLVVILRPKRWLRQAEDKKATWWRFLVFVAIGFYGGFVQAGVGILLLVGLVVGAGFDAVRANGVKLLLTLIFTLVALPIFAWNEQVDWFLGGLMGVGQGIGAYFSARFAVKSENAGVWIRRLLIVVASISATKLFGLW